MYRRYVTIYRDCSTVKMRAVDPVILVDPLPRTLAMICDPPTRARLDALGTLVVHEDGPMPDALVDAHLPDAVAILGQTAMPAERLERAPKLKAIVNVEGNFLPNVDYAARLDRGVHVLNASPAFALPVAEAALGMAIDLARGIERRRPRDARRHRGVRARRQRGRVPAHRQPGRHRRLRRPRPHAAPAARAVRLPGRGARPVAAGARDPPRRSAAGGARRPARDRARDLRVRVGDRRQRGLPRPRRSSSGSARAACSC